MGATGLPEARPIRGATAPQFSSGITIHSISVTRANLAKPGLSEQQSKRACPTGRHHASAVALHDEAVRIVGDVGVGGDIAER